MSKLKWRILTGSILVILTLAAIMWLSPLLFIILTTVIFLFATWEWSKLANLPTTRIRIGYVIITAILMLITWFVPIKPILVISLLWWLIAISLIVTYSKTNTLWSRSSILPAIMGFLTLIPCWQALILIRSAQNGTNTLIFLFAIVWSADIGAYFAGKWWGKHALIPKVSPQKTIEGLCGGFLLTIFVAVITCIVFNIPPTFWLVIILLAICTTFFSVIGDLLESMLKRQTKIKDIGHYLPGHGGLLDRIDSLTAAAPIFVLGCLLFGLLA